VTRPLMQHGVGQLEQLFATSKADAKVLKQLENELRYRQVPRAVALLAEVQSALYTQPPKASAPQPMEGKTDAPPQAEIPHPPPVQPALWTLPPGPSGGEPKESNELGQALGNEAGQPSPPIIRPAPTPAPATEIKSAKNEPRTQPMVTLADAYKLFKATPASSWASIEQARRLAVQAASPTRLSSLPETQQNSARDEARMLNAAYEVLAHARLASQVGS
jgi:hypothetical protein